MNFSGLHTATFCALSLFSYAEILLGMLNMFDNDDFLGSFTYHVPPRTSTNRHDLQ